MHLHDVNTSAKEGRSSGCFNAYQRGLTACTHKLSTTLGSLGAYTATHTKRVFWSTLLLSLIAAGGWAFVKIEDKGEKLWVPQGTKSFDDEAFVDANFMSRSPEVTILLTDDRPEHNGVLNAKAVRLMLDIHAEVAAITLTDHLKDGEPVTLAQLCLRDPLGECITDGIIEFFETPEGLVPSASISSDAQVLQAVNPVDGLYPLGQEVSVDAVFGRAEYDSSCERKPYRDGTACLSFAGGFLMSYLISGPSDVETAWYEQLTTLMKRRMDELDPDVARSLNFLHGDSFDDAIADSVGGDIPLVVVAVIVVLAISVLVLSRRNIVLTRSSLGIGGFCVVLLSTLAGYGIMMYAQVPFTSLVQLLPFILLGIGVDDMFVLIKAMEEVDAKAPGISTPERFRKCLETGGLAITVTSVTDVLAFALGSVTAIPSIRWFCWYAATAILVDYLLQITLFICLFKWTEDRIAKGKPDFACCCAKGAVTEAQQEAAHGPNIQRPSLDAARADPLERPVFPVHPTGAVVQLTENIAAARTDADRDAEAGGLPPPPAMRDSAEGGPDPKRVDAPLTSHKVYANKSWVQVFLEDYYVGFLTRWPVRIVVLLAFAGMAAFGIWASQNLTEGLPPADLAPDSHYMSSFFTAYSVFDDSATFTTEMYVRDVDLADPSVQVKALAAWQFAKEQSQFDLENSPTKSWLTELQAYVAEEEPAALAESGGVSRERFYPLLEDFLTVERNGYPVNAGWASDLSRKEGTGELLGAAFTLNHTPEGGQTGVERKRRQSALDTESSINSDIFGAENESSDRDAVLIFQSDYVFYETDRIIFKELLTNLGAAAVGVLTVALVLLVHPAAALLQVVAIVLVDLCLLAELYVFGIRLNTISVINLVMAVGLAVDYSVHVSGAFLQVPGNSRVDRIREALSEIGSAVVLGGTTTLCGILPLALSSSVIFRTFFALLLGTVVFGLLVGLVFVPVVLATVGPNLTAYAKDDALTGMVRQHVVADVVDGPGPESAET